MKEQEKKPHTSCHFTIGIVIQLGAHKSQEEEESESHVSFIRAFEPVQNLATVQINSKYLTLQFPKCGYLTRYTTFESKKNKTSTQTRRLHGQALYTRLISTSCCCARGRNSARQYAHVRSTAVDTARIESSWRSHRLVQPAQLSQIHCCRYRGQCRGLQEARLGSRYPRAWREGAASQWNSIAWAASSHAAAKLRVHRDTLSVSQPSQF